MLFKRTVNRLAIELKSSSSLYKDIEFNEVKKVAEDKYRDELSGNKEKNKIFFEMKDL